MPVKKGLKVQLRNVLNRLIPLAHLVLFINLKLLLLILRQHFPLPQLVPPYQNSYHLIFNVSHWHCSSTLIGH